MQVRRPPGPMVLAFGSRRVDVTHRAVVMGVLNRTKDSFYEPAVTFDLDAFFARAAQLVAEGADLLDVGGVKAGPGAEVSEQEELDRVVPAIEELTKRFDVPVSVDTWRASVAAASYEAGACVGNDISGFADPEYLPAAKRAGATVVATHIRLRPRVDDPHPHYDDVTATVTAFLLERRQWAYDAGLGPEQVILDAGLDLGKTAAQSLQLLRDSDRLSELGSPLLLSASNKTFLGKALNLEVGERVTASHAATAIGISLGCRIVRVHDVAGTVRVRDALERLSEAS
jgi:dihydropteroate synthase